MNKSIDNTDLDIQLYECYCEPCDTEWYPDTMDPTDAIATHDAIMHDGDEAAELRAVDPAEWDI